MTKKEIEKKGENKEQILKAFKKYYTNETKFKIDFRKHKKLGGMFDVLDVERAEDIIVELVKFLEELGTKEGVEWWIHYNLSQKILELQQTWDLKTILEGFICNYVDYKAFTKTIYNYNELTKEAKIKAVEHLQDVLSIVREKK